ncbi:hypothetical protein TCON_0737 [Astathelohania contejeani]|uniref:Uncharacterized protein n=1 Tax=Astathelohania contejeani TaxID=164912 RepID=A0ABQ7I104_9MICR|nr:hypothetical protein TCON_0737 [Thelohania contejeani]
MRIGLQRMEVKSQCMLYGLWETLEKYKNVILREAAMLKDIENNKTYFSLIQNYFNINKNKSHEKLHIAQSNNIVCLINFFILIKHRRNDHVQKQFILISRIEILQE